MGAALFHYKCLSVTMPSVIGWDYWEHVCIYSYIFCVFKLEKACIKDTTRISFR